MRGRPSPPVLAAALVLLLAAVVVEPAATASSVDASPPRFPGAAAPLTGLLSTSTVQTVSGTTFWTPLCARAASINCIVPSGVAFVPPAGEVLVTESVALAPFDDHRAVDAYEELNPVTMEFGPVVNLDCFPESPFYPGVGIDVFIGCFNASKVVVVDAVTGTIVANISTPFAVLVLTYDPQDRTVYAGGNGDTILALNLSGENASSDASVPNAMFLGSFDMGPGLAYDPATARLLSFSSSDQLLSTDPTTGVTESLVRLPPTPTALAVDPVGGLILASIDDPQSVLAFNATTFAQVANFSLPNCVNNLCGESQVTQFVLDPRHGDDYLASGLALFAVNVSTLSIVGTVITIGDGWCGSATYVSATDSVWGTYWSPETPGPGYVAELVHGVATTGGTVFGLPLELGILVVGAGAGVGSALVYVARGARTGVRGNPPP